MSPKTLTSVTVISSPYHVGLRPTPPDHSVGGGPDFIKSAGLDSRLQRLGVPIHHVEIQPPAGFEGEIGRSFEVMSRISKAVTAARNQGSFPVVLAGNCNASVGVASGLWNSDDLKGAADDALAAVWFDAHDDYDIPDTVLNGYFDSQGLAIMAGECWKAVRETIPGYRPTQIRNVIHCGLRDVIDLQKGRVEASELGVVWGDSTKRVDFEAGLRKEMDARFTAGNETAMLVHLDLDSMDPTVGKSNSYFCSGGLEEEDLRRCVSAISEKTIPVAFTVASFDPEYDAGEGAQRLAAAAIEAVEKVLEGLKDRGVLQPGK